MNIWHSLHQCFETLIIVATFKILSPNFPDVRNLYIQQSLQALMEYQLPYSIYYCNSAFIQLQQIFSNADVQPSTSSTTSCNPVSHVVVCNFPVLITQQMFHAPRSYKQISSMISLTGGCTIVLRMQKTHCSTLRFFVTQQNLVSLYGLACATAHSTAEDFRSKILMKEDLFPDMPVDFYEVKLNIQRIYVDVIHELLQFGMSMQCLQFQWG